MENIPVRHLGVTAMQSSKTPVFNIRETDRKNHAVNNLKSAKKGFEKLPFLHISQLISNKKAVDRPKDQLDVIALEKLQQMQEKQARRDNSDNDRRDDHETRSYSL
jgi:hypothetical protein